MFHKRKGPTVWAALALACAFGFGFLVPAAAKKGGEEKSAVSSFSKTAPEGRLVLFSDADFLTHTKGGDPLSAIVIRTLPEQGSLLCAGAPLEAGSTVSARRLSTLCYSPDTAAEVRTQFTFAPVFLHGGEREEAVTVSLHLSDKPNEAPVAVALEAETYADLPLTGALKAVDPEGDPCGFELVSQARRGSVEITESGFVYTPAGKAGKDSFTYVAVDDHGNRSKPAAVTVKVIKRGAREAAVYTDMGDSSAHYAALRLRQAGIFSGEKLGSETFFYPEKPLTRAEFLTLTAAVAELPMPTAAVATGLSDNADIPAWTQSYVAAGLTSGVIRGISDGLGNRAFYGDQIITRAEAAAILDRALTLPRDGRVPAFCDAEEIPGWAKQSVANATAAGILPAFSDNTVRCGNAVTREDAAMMLYHALCYLQDKER
ncbi:MAG: S-layer homology domain-containing protein [Clostridia bacterium]|nr:S-layer homology domain-containing protein [Clostridia bacterium]